MKFLVALWRNHDYEQPIHTIDNMPEHVIAYGALAGFIFLALIFYSNYKERKKRNFKSFKYNQDRYYDNNPKNGPYTWW